MKKITTFLLCVVFVGSSALWAQNVQVSGVVTDAADGQPLPGVSVVVKGERTSASTDVNGRYTISVPGDATLAFSYVGMKTQEHAVAGRSAINVALESGTTQLEEVMVVAYGTTTRKSFTGSAAVIKEEAIEKNQSSNISNNLAGKVAGVQGLSSNGQPGSGSTIRIRGIGSMSASNAPLYVVDGVPYDGDISAINNADIESVTTLKDAASAALYGARGANGVIIVTTKRGKGGAAKVKVDTKWGSNARAIPTYKVMTDPAQYYETFYRALYNSQVNTKGPDAAHKYANENLLTSTWLGYQVYTVPNGQRFIGTNFKLNPNATPGYSDGKNTFLADNWFDEIFKANNLRQEYNVSVSGSNEKLSYFVSGNYLGDTGIVENSDFQRFSSRLNVDYQVKSWLKLTSNINFSHVDTRYPSEQTSDAATSSVNIFGVSNMMAPIYPLYIRDAAGNIMTDARGYTMYDYGDGKIVNAKRQFMPMSNPASMLLLNIEQSSINYFTGKWSAVAELTDGLKATATLGVTSADERNNMLANPYYGQYAESGGYVTVQAARAFSVNQQYLLTYAKKFDAHNIDVLAGLESYKLKSASLWGTKKKIFQDRVPEINNAILEPNTGSSTDSYAVLGILSQFKYDYSEKYFASLSYRRDASSSFAPENRWGNFWSAGAAWDVSSESFMDDLSQINLLKLKISYGAQGNDKLYYSGSSTTNYYPYQDQYEVSENNGEFAVTRFYKGNKDITWETSYNFNAGVDFSLFDDRFSGTIEGFSRKTVDMLYYRPVSPSLGYNEVPVNIGSIRNAGLEIDLRGDVFKTKSILVSVYGNLTYFKNKILELAPELNGQWISGSYIYKEGESMYNFYIREYAGVDKATGDGLWYVDVKDDAGNVTGRTTTTSWSTATQYEQGDHLPKVYGGFGASLEAYGFDLSVDFAYQLGGRILDNTYTSLMHAGNSSNAGTNWHADILNAWTPENTNTDVPRLNAVDNYADYTSTRYLVSSNYLSVQNITLGYTLPGKWVKKVNIEKIRIFGVADNVALFSARQGLDPRQGYNSSYSGSSYLPIRSISAGINLTF
jgi:TonB-linked SusC/RagA family outer membrane protein